MDRLETILAIIACVIVYAYGMSHFVLQKRNRSISTVQMTVTMIRVTIVTGLCIVLSPFLVALILPEIIQNTIEGKKR